MKKTLKVFEIIFQVILVIIIIINLISIVSVKIMKNPYPNVFGYSYFTVISGSMKPTINVGDEVIVKITKDIKENDIITFTEDDIFVTHRVKEITDEGIVTQGDNNESEDNIKKPSDVVGKVELIIPKLGKIKYIITNIYFIVALVICYIIYEILLYIYDKNDEKKEKENKEDKVDKE